MAGVIDSSVNSGAESKLGAAGGAEYKPWKNQQSCMR